MKNLKNPTNPESIYAYEWFRRREGRCPNCGAKILGYYRYCPECGALLESEDIPEKIDKEKHPSQLNAKLTSRIEINPRRFWIIPLISWLISIGYTKFFIDYLFRVPEHGFIPTTLELFLFTPPFCFVFLLPLFLISLTTTIVLIVSIIKSCHK